MATSKFIQIFLANRFCQWYNEDVNSLLTQLPEKHKSSVQNLIALLKDLGIVEYMNQLSDDRDDFETALSAFIDNITSTYPHKFHNLIYSSSYSSKQNLAYIKQYHPFQQSILHQPDMFVTILQCLDLKSLNSCSLVNSHWLINAFNPNCLQFLDFNEIAVKSKTKIGKFNRNYKRVGQRFCNAKCISINDLGERINFGVVSKILSHCHCSMVEKLDMAMHDYSQKDSFKCIKSLQKFGPKLQFFLFLGGECPLFFFNDNGATYQETLFYDSIHLINCDMIQVESALFPIIVTKKCRKLSLEYQCFLDFRSKHFDVSGVTLLNLTSFFLIDANIIHDNYNFLKNFLYEYDSRDTKTMHLGITDENLVALAKQFCNGVGILTLTIDSLVCDFEEAHWRIIRLWQLLNNNNNQRTIFTSLKLINGEYCDGQIDEIVAKRLAVSELIIDKHQYCVISYETDVQCLVKFMDYMLYVNNTINENKFEFLRVGWEFEEQLLIGIVDKFNELKNKNKKQFAAVAKELKMVQMPYNCNLDEESLYKTVKPSNSFGISTIMSILKLIEEINHVKAQSNSNSKHQLKPSKCQFMAHFGISDDCIDKDVLQTFLTQIKNLMKQQIPIHIKIWVPNVRQLNIDSLFTVNFDSSGASKWYQKPICNDKYGMPRCNPHVLIKGDESAVEISNIEHSGYNGIKFE